MLAPMDAGSLAAIFRSLNDEGVRYVVFGGIAVIARGVTRATQDLDLFLDPAPANVDAARRALQRVFGDPALDELTSSTMSEYGLVRYGPPDHDFVIDLTTRIGDAFAFADLEASPVELHGELVPVASVRTLIRMKRESRRDKDRSDVVRLRERHGIEEL
ncbi:MAG TPA: nucleotidyltransferase [Thermoanaerobaculia bacterium]|nr:nucleotidyltransferase [Thermoanaerobaculia bacterium]